MRAAIYTRISADRTGHSLGITRQAKAATALATTRGYTIIGTYSDNDISASRYNTRTTRPEWARLLADTAAGGIDVIVAFHTDRLYRQPRELEDLIDLAENTLIVTCEGDFDLSTGDGRAMARVIAAFAAKESDDKSRRIRAKHLELAEAGLPSGGRRAFGYEPDKLTVRPAEAKLIAQAVRLVLAGESLRSVTRRWRDAGVPTVTGRSYWQPNVVRNVLTSHRIAGLRVHRGQVVGPAAWPAIITPEESAAVRGILLAPRPAYASTAHKYLLAGLLECGRCGARMQVRPTARGVPRYHCHADRGGCDRCGISARRLEDDVVALVLAATRPVPARQAEEDVRDDEIVGLLAALDAERTGLAGDYADGVLSREAYVAAAGALDRRHGVLRDELRDARLRTMSAGFRSALDPAEHWGGMSFDQRRAVLQLAIEKITVQPTTRANNRYDPTRWIDHITWR